MNNTRMAVSDFIDHFAIRSQRTDRHELLAEVADAFAHLPYENLTKLIRKHTEPPGPSRRRMPADVVRDHLEHGTGGTCFALTTLFDAVLRHLGFGCSVVLCDSRRATNSHCALVVSIDDTPHLLDPGYLIHRPLLMLAGQTSQQQGAASLRLVGDPTGRSFELFSDGKPRYRVKKDQVSEQQLLPLWDDSFDWTMMNDVHICQAEGDGYAYLHGSKLRRQGRRTKQTDNIRELSPGQLAQRFGISPQIIERAYALVVASREKGLPK